jgi:general secretion pathway protein D
MENKGEKVIAMNMNKSIGTSSRRFLAAFLSLCLLLPGAALADGKNGKKNFKEGLKYEQLQQWDMAAQRFALALSAEPNNPEYKVHYLQALQRASLMYITRGDALAEQNDYPGAYVAYRQAFNYDPGNEIARFKMERMLELQKAQASGTSEQINYNTKTGSIKPVGREIQVANKPRSSRDLPMDVNLIGAPFKHTIKSLAGPLKLNAVFDDQVADTLRVTIDMENVTPAKAIDIILMQKKLAFEQVDRRTIFIYPDNVNNRPRFEKLLIKTFYLNNVSAQTVKNVLSQMLPPGRQSATVDQVGGSGGSNVLIVKATPAELQLVQDLINNIDKNKNEVVLDIEIYEVGNDSLTQIGNQFLSSPAQAVRNIYDDKNNVTGSVTTQSPSLSNLGGIGLGLINGLGDTAIGGNTFAPFLGGIGTLVGFPPSQISLLQSRGKSKLLHKTQIHVLDGGENETKVGRSVPVRLGTTVPGYGLGFGGLNGINGVNNGNNNGGIGQNIVNGLAAGLGGLGFGNGFDSIQYRDVGLVIKAKPQITNEGYVEIKMNFESSDIVASGGDIQNLTPTFTQRSLNTVARIQDGVTAVVAGVNQDVKNNARAGLPVFGMLPLVGRLFATPRQETRQTDVIITVTPHIIRSAGITAEDHLARIGPPQAGGMNQSIEDVINRAQVEEEQEQRLIAEQQSAGAPLNAGVSAPTSQPANFNNQQGPGASQPFNYNVRQPQNAGSQPTVQPSNNPNNRGRIGGLAQTANPAGDAPPAVPEKQQSETLVAPEDDGQPRPETNVGKGTPEQAAQDTVVASLSPENVDRAVSQMLAEKKARRAIENANVDNSTVSFSLSPKPIMERLGKTFTVTVEVNGQRQMSGADVALKYDATMLLVKSVRDAGLFGSRPAFTYDYNKKGVLNISIGHPQSSPMATSGRLVTIEFYAIGEGQSEIAITGSLTKARSDDAQIPATGAATQVIIGRDGASSSKE